MTDKDQCSSAFDACQEQTEAPYDAWVAWQAAWSHLTKALAASQEREAQLARLAKGALRDFSADRHAAVVHALQVIHGALSTPPAQSEQASQAPLCEACEVRHWPMQNTLCPATEKAWAAVYKARGYKLVPIEPTTEMINAGMRPGRGFYELGLIDEAMAEDCYRSMIAAAPKSA